MKKGVFFEKLLRARNTNQSALNNVMGRLSRMFGKNRPEGSSMRSGISSGVDSASPQSAGRISDNGRNAPIDSTPSRHRQEIEHQEAELCRVLTNSVNLQKNATELNQQANRVARKAVDSGGAEVDDLIKIDELSKQADDHVQYSIRHLFNRKGRLVKGAGNLPSLEKKTAACPPSGQYDVNPLLEAENKALGILSEFEHATAEKQHSGETVHEMISRFSEVLNHVSETCKKLREDEKTQVYNAEEIGSHIQQFSAGKSVVEIPADKLESESAAMNGFALAGLHAALRIQYGALSIESILREQTNLSNRMAMTLNGMELSSNVPARVNAILNHLAELERSGEFSHLDEELKDMVQKTIMAGHRAKQASGEQATLLTEELSSLEVVVRDSNRLVEFWKKLSNLVERNFGTQSGSRINEEASNEIIRIVHDVIAVATTMRQADLTLENVKTKYSKDVDPAIESFINAILEMETFLRQKSLPEIKRMLSMAGTKSTRNPAEEKPAKNQTGAHSLTAEQRSVMDKIVQSAKTVSKINGQIADKHEALSTAGEEKQISVLRETQKLRTEKIAHQKAILDSTLKLNHLWK